MRFDLTNASYRVLDRAAKLPLAPSGISPAKLLIALFEEEECRAADWLSQADLSLDKFRRDFGMDDAVATLQSPISAPGFPVGDYGVPPGLYQGTVRTGSPKVEASPAGNDAAPVGYPEPDRESSRGEPESSRETHPEPDDWTSGDTGDRRYSLYPRYRNETGGPKSSLRLFFDDRPVSVGRISGELEASLQIVLQQFVRPDRGRSRFPGAGGGVVSVNDAEFSSPFSLATEHLLFVALLDDGDVGRWLRDAGFDAAELSNRIETIGSNGEQSPGNAVSDTTLDFPAEISIDDVSAESETKPTSAGTTDAKLYRLFDAAVNRAREAVRVVEDFVRFVLDDRDLTRQLKDFRHEFHEISRKFPNRFRLGARDTQSDVGTEIEVSGEYRRETPHDVLSANFARLQESLRSLEEFSKLVEPELSRRYEKLRYRCYSLHKSICLAEPGRIPSPQNDGPDLRGLLDEARLYALLDIRSDEKEFAERLRNIIAGGVDMVQLRDKSADDRTLLSRSRILKRVVEESGKNVLFIMNDRPDLARLSGADGVHVGQEELGVEDVRRIVGRDMLVGVSTHDIDQAHRAVSDGADYIGVGPVFESSTKKFAEPVGPEFLRRVVAEIRLPAFAIGGISPENLDEVLATGAVRIAVGSALTDSDDPEKAARCLFEHLHNPPTKP